MDQIRLILGIAAAVLHGIAFLLYARQTKLGQSKPNVATWSVSMFLTLLNALTFREMSGDRVATFQFFVGFAGCSFIFFYALAKRNFSRPGRIEVWAMLLGVIAGVIWYVFRQAMWAQMIVLAALVISGAPTFVGVLRDPFKETPRSWTMWTTAYVITTGNLLLNPGWHAESLVNPIISIFEHGGIAFLSRDKRKRQFAFSSKKESKDGNWIREGMRVRTASQLGDTMGMFVHPHNLEARQSNKEGFVRGYVAGHGGDVWWVKHDDGTIGAYCYDEFDPV